MVGFIVLSWLLVGLMAWQVNQWVQQRSPRRVPVTITRPRRLMDEE